MEIVVMGFIVGYVLSAVFVAIGFAIGTSINTYSDRKEGEEMNSHEERYDFYLKNHDFEVFVNKGCQSYNRILHDVLDDPIVIEYYRSLQKGGCNESKRNN